MVSEVGLMYLGGSLICVIYDDSIYVSEVDLMYMMIQSNYNVL